MPKSCGGFRHSVDEHEDEIITVLIFSALGVILVITMVIVGTRLIPAESPIDESCYNFKSPTLIIVEYYEVDNCNREIIKMYEYGYTDVSYAGESNSLNKIFMFKK